MSLHELPLEVLQYAAGQIDGDGHIIVATNNNLQIGLDKALKGHAALSLF
jgi:hypothetical protein